MSLECRHHWIIEPANGAESQGQCMHCRTERTFSNTPQDNWQASEARQKAAKINKERAMRKRTRIETEEE